MVLRAFDVNDAITVGPDRDMGDPRATVLAVERAATLDLHRDPSPRPLSRLRGDAGTTS
jgi:hypothetical protein